MPIFNVPVAFPRKAASNLQFRSEDFPSFSNIPVLSTDRFLLRNKCLFPFPPHARGTARYYDPRQRAL